MGEDEIMHRIRENLLGHTASAGTVAAPPALTVASAVALAPVPPTTVPETIVLRKTLRGRVRKIKHSIGKRAKTVGVLLSAPFRSIRKAWFRRLQRSLTDVGIRQVEQHDAVMQNAVGIRRTQDSLLVQQRAALEQQRVAIEALRNSEQAAGERFAALQELLGRCLEPQEVSQQSRHAATMDALAEMQRDYSDLLAVLRQDQRHDFAHQQTTLASLQQDHQDAFAHLHAKQQSALAAIQEVRVGTVSDLRQVQQAAYTELKEGLQTAFDELNQGLQIAFDDLKQQQVESASWQGTIESSLQTSIDSSARVTWSTLDELRAAALNSLQGTETRVAKSLVDGLCQLQSESISPSHQAIIQRQDSLEATQKQLLFEMRAQMSELRRIFASSVIKSAASAEPSLSLISRSNETSGCRVCGGELTFKWTLPVLHQRHKAHYHECRDCQALQVVDPHWLAEAYASENEPLIYNPDHGRFIRNFTTYSYLRAFQQAGVIAAQPRMLDYGGGYGLLTNMLRADGVDAWQYDQHIDRPFLAEEYSLSDLDSIPDGTFDVVTSFEVMEHLTNPREVGMNWRRILSDRGTLVLTTSVYHPGEHGADWFYLCTEYGQHVTLWSRSALAKFAADCGFRSVGYGPDPNGWAIVMSMLPEQELQAALGQACRILAEPAFIADITQGWKHGITGDALTKCSPIVHPIPGMRRDAA